MNNNTYCSIRNTKQTQPKFQLELKNNGFSLSPLKVILWLSLLLNIFLLYKLNSAPKVVHTPPITMESQSNAEELPLEKKKSVVPASELNSPSALQPTPNIEKPTTTEIVEKKVEVESDWHIIRIQKGENLARIFAREGLSSKQLMLLLKDPEVKKNLIKILPGETLEIKLGADQQLLGLRYAISSTQTLIIEYDNNQFKSHVEEKPITTEAQYAHAVIENSLFDAGQKHNISDKLLLQFAEIFGWDVDFAKDLRKGDEIHLTYEVHKVDGKPISTGDILAAEFINKNTSYKAVRFLDSYNHAHYYTPDGYSMRKAFLRTPVNFTRISSKFNPGRLHPILHRIRSHKGVDYAAPTGTPIKASGDGRITFIGKKGGYGNVVILNHGAGYSTVYGHMVRFASKLKRGSRVQQGQVIGYVGQTGLANGPHLHYEFRVNGVQRDPLKVQLPKAEPIAKKYHQKFVEKTQQLLEMLNSFKRKLVQPEMIS